MFQARAYAFKCVATSSPSVLRLVPHLFLSVPIVLLSAPSAYHSVSIALQMYVHKVQTRPYRFRMHPRALQKSLQLLAVGTMYSVRYLQCSVCRLLRSLSSSILHVVIVRALWIGECVERSHSSAPRSPRRADSGTSSLDAARGADRQEGLRASGLALEDHLQHGARASTRGGGGHSLARVQPKLVAPAGIGTAQISKLAVPTS